MAIIESEIKMSSMEAVKDFMWMGGQELDQALSPARLEFRTKLLMEEVEETSAEALSIATTLCRGGDVSPEDIAALLKELCDVQYVLDGFFLTFGFNKDFAFERVHESNMSKLGGVTKDEDGKIMKGKNYKKPDLTDLV